MIICCMVAWPEMSLRNAVPRIKKTTPLRKLFGVPATDSKLETMGESMGFPMDSPRLSHGTNHPVNRQPSPSCFIVMTSSVDIFTLVKLWDL